MGAREKILKRLKQASNRRGKIELKQPDWETSVYLEQGKDLAKNFQTNLELVAGKVIRTKNLESATDEIKKLLAEPEDEKPFCFDPKLKKAFQNKINFTSQTEDFENLQVGITPCEFLVAHLGSVMVSSGGTSGRKLYVFPETHLVIAHEKQLVNHLDDAIGKLQQKYKDKLPSMITNITGPSRTADIEKTLVMGMHGPRKLFVLLCQEPF